jgi:hypothetical protein
MDEILNLELYECPACKNQFYIERVGIVDDEEADGMDDDIKELNMANYCCFCGVQYDYEREGEDWGYEED